MSRLQGFILCAFLLLATSTDVRAQQVDPDLWHADGSVRALAIAGNTLYLGGSFGYVGPHVGATARFDPATGAVLAGFPKVRGTVSVIVDDGAGGWYIGGTFDQVGGLPRQNLARVRSDLSVDPWGPLIGGATIVPAIYTLLVSGNTVYVGGGFTVVNGEPRQGLAAVDATTGAVSNFDPSPDGWVFALALSGTTLYVGGGFNTIGGVARAGLAAIRTNNGHATAWDPAANVASVGHLILDGSTLYVSGPFTEIGDQPRNRLAALDVATGLATPWDPGPNGPVTSLLLDGSTVYVGGRFTSIGGQSRARLAAVDKTSGEANEFAPDPDEDALGHSVDALAIDGKTLYAGGGFRTIGGASRSRLAALDVTTGDATAWDGSVNSHVLALRVTGSGILAGGRFTLAGGKVRSNLAALDLALGTATAWNPGASSRVDALVTDGVLIHAAGVFGSIGGQPREGLASVDAATGLATNWNPEVNGIFGPQGQPIPGVATTLALDGGTLYVGGTFGGMNGQNRGDIAAFDVATGDLLPWVPRPFGGYLTSCDAIDASASDVFVGGAFGDIGGEQRANIASVDPVTASATAFDPLSNARILSLVRDGSLVYAGGMFASIGGESRARLAALDAGTGDANAWDPGADGDVLALAVQSGTVFAGGNFAHAGGEPRNGIAALDATSGAALSWDAGTDGPVEALLIAGTTLYVGGAFSTVAGVNAPGIAAVSLPAAIGVPPVPGTSAGLAFRSTIPHPIAGEGTLRFFLPRAGAVSLDLVDPAGRRVRGLLHARALGAGDQQVSFDRGALAAGIYFARLTLGGDVVTTKLVLSPD